ncbi:MAG: ATP-grasp domain-containing protein [Spirochaetota bacterium]
MSLKVTELTFLKYYAHRYGIPVPGHIDGNADIEDIKKALEEWGGEAIVKPDVLAGERGKSGAIVHVKNLHEALREIKRVSGMEINGKIPRTAYLVENIPAKMEIYSAITYNSSFLAPSFTASLAGGIDVEEIPDDKKITIPIDIFKGLDAYQASEVFSRLGCPKDLIGILSRSMVSFWDLFISTGMELAEINPWRITHENKPYACDFKGIVDEANYKSKVPGVEFPEYPESFSEFEEEMRIWDSKSHQGQAHVSNLGGTKILPILFGGGVSAIITETLDSCGGSPMFLSDFGGNPPYERMFGTAKICFKHRLASAKLLLILGGKANNTLIDVTFQAIADALLAYTEERGPVNIPVVIGRGGPNLVKGVLAMKQTLEYLKLPYVIFGPETPVTMVAEYAARLVNAIETLKEVPK